MTHKKDTEDYIDNELDISSSGRSNRPHEGSLQSSGGVEANMIHQMLDDTAITNLSSAKANWYFGEWQALIDLDIKQLANHPDVAKFAALKAAAYQQLDDMDNAKIYVQLARNLGCDNALISKLLIAGIHNTLGKVAALKNDDKKMLSHFKSAINIEDKEKNNQLAVQARSVRELADLGMLPLVSKIMNKKVADIDKHRYEDLNVKSKINALNAELRAVNKKIEEKSIYQNNSDNHDKTNKRIILIGSIPRSGSTWLFNCVRHILIKRNIDFYSSWIKDYDESNPATYHVVKAHEPDADMAEKATWILSSRRDIRDIAGSLLRMGWAESGQNLITQLLNYTNNQHAFWYSRSIFELEYDDIEKRPSRTIEQICRILMMPLASGKIKEIKKDLKEMTSPEEYDKVTQMHPMHRSYGKVDYDDLLADQRNEIELACSEWLYEYFYL